MYREGLVTCYLSEYVQARPRIVDDRDVTSSSDLDVSVPPGLRVDD